MSSQLFVPEEHEAVAPMRRRLDAFYADSQEYRAFSQVSQQGDCWQYVLQEMAARSPRPRVLEFGAGRSGFGPYLQQHKDNPVNWQVWSKKTLEFALMRKKTIINKLNKYGVKSNKLIKITNFILDRSY